MVELLYPSDSLKTTQEKIKEYIDNGVQLGLLINLSLLKFIDFQISQSDIKDI